MISEASATDIKCLKKMLPKIAAERRCDTNGSFGKARALVKRSGRHDPLQTLKVRRDHHLLTRKATNHHEYRGRCEPLLNGWEGANDPS